MIQFGKDLGLNPIKCTNKEGTDQLKSLHYQVNDILFTLNGKLVFKSTATKAFNSLTELGKTIKELPVPDKANAKKEEILGKLREVCLKLRNYITTYKEEESDVPAMQKSVNFWLHRYIDEKSKNGLTLSVIVSLLQDQKELWENVYHWRDQLKLDNFRKANTEIMGMVTRICTIKEESYE